MGAAIGSIPGAAIPWSPARVRREAPQLVLLVLAATPTAAVTAVRRRFGGPRLSPRWRRTSSCWPTSSSNFLPGRRRCAFRRFEVDSDVTFGAAVAGLGRVRRLAGPVVFPETDQRSSSAQPPMRTCIASSRHPRRLRTRMATCSIAFVIRSVTVVDLLARAQPRGAASTPWPVCRGRARSGATCHHTTDADLGAAAVISILCRGHFGFANNARSGGSALVTRSWT